MQLILEFFLWSTFGVMSLWVINTFTKDILVPYILSKVKPKESENIKETNLSKDQNNPHENVKKPNLYEDPFKTWPNGIIPELHEDIRVWLAERETEKKALKISKTNKSNLNPKDYTKLITGHDYVFESIEDLTTALNKLEKFTSAILWSISKYLNKKDHITDNDNVVFEQKIMETFKTYIQNSDDCILNCKDTHLSSNQYLLLLTLKSIEIVIDINETITKSYTPTITYHDNRLKELEIQIQDQSAMLDLPVDEYADAIDYSKRISDLYDDYFLDSGTKYSTNHESLFKAISEYSSKLKHMINGCSPTKTEEYLNTFKYVSKPVLSRYDRNDYYQQKLYNSLVTAFISPNKFIMKEQNEGPIKYSEPQEDVLLPDHDSSFIKTFCTTTIPDTYNDISIIPEKETLETLYKYLIKCIKDSTLLSSFTIFMDDNVFINTENYTRLFNNNEEYKKFTQQHNREYSDLNIPKYMKYREEQRSWDVNLKATYIKINDPTIFISDIPKVITVPPMTVPHSKYSQDYKFIMINDTCLRKDKRFKSIQREESRSIHRHLDIEALKALIDILRYALQHYDKIKQYEQDAEYQNTDKHKTITTSTYIEKLNKCRRKINGLTNKQILDRIHLMCK